ncbi:MAG: HU family DNA-binding protein [Lachnospiraceae bacterium]|nr:HU family DNA-binding protein [Lachnospiraceae bacterium]
MNKSELVAAIAAKAGVTKDAAKKMVDAFQDAVTEELAKGKEKKVALVGFGTFEVSKRPARSGRNPLTGKKIKIAASNQPKFKAGKALKAAVNK